MMTTQVNETVAAFGVLLGIAVAAFLSETKEERLPREGWEQKMELEMIEKLGAVPSS
ncbi:hypothetical protein [Falsirhodobacter sp. 1013]|uniref:hypothetical protein n=1 Tax=Falsirhodobacter sp. 1013 TaxID=3417566 RepID=UPI003EB9C892